jgi:nitrite reductase (NADH) large subunit
MRLLATALALSLHSCVAFLPPPLVRRAGRFARPANTRSPAPAGLSTAGAAAGDPLDLTPSTVVVIGNGMVGHKFIEQVLEPLEEEGGKPWRVVTFSEEPMAAYNRMRLTEFFKNRDANDLSMSGEYFQNGSTSFYDETDNVEIFIGDKATRIDTESRLVHSESGRSIAYDAVVLATGSYPFVPPIQGIEKPGVFVYRTIDDLEQIIAYQKAHNVKAAAVIGGGLLGLEAAKAAYDLGMEAHIMEFAPILMCRQIDEAGHQLLAGMIEELGLRVHCNARTSEVVGEDRVLGLRYATAGAKTEDGEDAPEEIVDVGMIIVSAGIRPRDEVAKDSGLEVHPRGGVIVDDQLRTSDPSVFAIGEVALHDGKIYGLVAPGYDMANKLANNLRNGAVTPGVAQTVDDDVTQKFMGADMSTKLKLMGVDVASFGDYTAADASTIPEGGEGDSQAYAVTVNDPITKVYKKLVFAEGGKKLVGGILVGDASDYTKYLALTKSADPLEVTPAELVVGITSAGGGGGGDDVTDMSDEAQVCSCNDVSKGSIVAAVKDGCDTLGAVKSCTKAGTGCGGCVPLVTDLFSATMESMGTKVTNHLCEHFHYSRREMYDIIKVKGYKSFEEVLADYGEQGDGCEICKPAVASILASIYNEVILDDGRATLQDTNDRSLANMQRGGTYSVIPRIAGGEIKPEGLVAIGQIAEEFGLYTKITGAQRIDLLGAYKHDLPKIWEKLGNAGFESGHAYGKALRTVKSCVGSAWCRYGMRDSVKFAIEVENRYKGLRAPHKLKSAVSGCIRECAEAQCKDFGMIATENGYNLYVCGNGGASPRHGDLLAADIDEETVLKYLDRFLIYYISTADRLQRTAAWMDKLEGGIDHLRDVVVHDKLGINADLEAQMQHIVDTYHDEWAEVVKSEPRSRRFRQFVNSPDTQKTIQFIEERGQWRPADWGKSIEWHLPDGAREDIAQAEDSAWVDVGGLEDFPAKTGSAVLYGNVQLAVFRYSDNEWYATQNMSPKKRAFVLSEGLLGSADGIPKVACPLLKQQFALTSGECIDDPSLAIMTFPVRVAEGGDRVELYLPPTAKLDALLATDDLIVSSSCADSLDALINSAAGATPDIAIPDVTGVKNTTQVSSV